MGIDLKWSVKSTMCMNNNIFLHDYAIIICGIVVDVGDRIVVDVGGRIGRIGRIVGGRGNDENRISNHLGKKRRINGQSNALGPRMPSRVPGA